MPNLDLPSSVDVITEDRARRSAGVADRRPAARHRRGGQVGNQQFRTDSFFLRGFEVRARDYRKNGFLDPTYTPRDFANVERIEVLKGPASMLYGAGQPSGMVNLITKKPLDQAMYDGGVQFGSFGLQRYTIDATGPIERGQKSLLYRINAAYEDDDSFRDFGFIERTFVSPVADVGARLRHDADLGGRIRQRPPAARHGRGRHQRQPGGPAHQPLPRRAVERFPALTSTTAKRLMLTHQINEDWAWNFGGYSVFYGGPSSATYPGGLRRRPDSRRLGQDVFFRSRQNIGPWQEQYQSAIANVSGKFYGDVVTHNVVLGTEQGWLISDPLPRSPVDPQRRIRPRGWPSTA